MARSSTKENKNLFWQAREAMGLSREAASELLETITPERIERIETEKFMPHPDEVLQMATKYKTPTLCNAYCSQQCPIGQQYVPEIRIKGSFADRIGDACLSEFYAAADNTTD